MAITFLGKPIHGNRKVLVAAYAFEPGDPAHVKDLCEHLLKIIEEIEWHRCEGRLLPVELYDKIDSIRSELDIDPKSRIPRLLACAAELGCYYQIDNLEEIEIGHLWPPSSLPKPKQNR